jgi:hypothetical protein
MLLAILASAWATPAARAENRAAPGASGAAQAQGGAAPSEITSPPRVIVLCSPGSPGNTASAQPTMDRFARYLETGASFPAGRLSAIYFETEQGGLDRLAAKDVVLALLSLPLYLESESKFALKPLLQIETESGALEQWSLAAKKGALKTAAGLAGWEITGIPGYAPPFVRGPILGKWGEVPASATITFSAGVVGSLRSASSGENLAVLLDHVQAASLPTLPFAQQLEIVTRSRMMPGSLVCSVGGRLTAAETSNVVDALIQMSRKPDAQDLLSSMRVKRFMPVDAKSLDAVRQSFAAAVKPAG